MTGTNEHLVRKDQAPENRSRMDGKDAQPLPEPLVEATKGFAAGAVDEDAQQPPGKGTWGGQH